MKISKKTKSRLIDLLRWVVSITFFFLAVSKGQVLFKYGIEPYEKYIAVTGLPGILKYYGPVAFVLEILLAVTLWGTVLYKTAIISVACLTGTGVLVSIYSLLYKLTSDCGCGLLGDNEYGLLAQKLVILLALYVLFKNEQRAIAC